MVRRGGAVIARRAHRPRKAIRYLPATPDQRRSGASAVPARAPIGGLPLSASGRRREIGARVESAGYVCRHARAAKVCVGMTSAVAYGNIGTLIIISASAR